MLLSDVAVNEKHYIYRVNETEIDTFRVCVRRDGKEQHLRQKAFQVLVYLLQNRPRVISKDELIAQVWEGAAVSDNSLERCLFEIRKLLRDDSRQPRFIKTVPRAGYRFIGEVQEIDPEQIVTEEHSPATETRPESTAAHSKSGRRFTGPRVLATAVFLVIASIATTEWYLTRKRETSQFLAGTTLTQDPTKRSVAVMFFENESDSTELNWLREGLADMMITGLSRSSNLTVLSRQQLHVLLDRVGHNEAEKIRLEEAIDIAQKSQAQLFIMGSFARLGDQIRIDAQLHNVRDGQLLAAERLVVNEPAQILTQIDLLSLKLASHLGASSDPEANASLTTVMTTNLEAYRYYSLGLAKAQSLQNPEAIALFEKAIALDRQFAMAYARTGYAYAITWNRIDEGKPYLEKAFQLSARLTEKDKLYIAGWYAIANFDYSGAIKSFQEIVRRFPPEVEAYRRLGLLLAGDERFNEAIEDLKQGLIIDSDAKDLYNALGSVYSGLGRHDEAIALFRRYVQLAPEEPNAHDSLGEGYQWAGRYDEAVAEYQRALSLKPDFEISIVHLGNLYFQQGRYREAIKQYQQYIQRAPWGEERARGYSCISYVELKTGNLKQAQRSAMAAEKYNKREVDQSLLITLQRKDLATAEKLEEQYERYQRNDRGRRMSPRPLLFYRGSFDLAAGRVVDAIAEFKELLSHPPQTWNIDAYEDCLANAYLESGRFDEAIDEYQRILKLNPNYPLVHYHLAQAFAKKGQQDQARAEREQFLRVWKDADSDIPEVVAARKTELL